MRSSRAPWQLPPPRVLRPVTQNLSCEVLVVGAGITGALVAEALTRQGHDVVLIDREQPGRGSTLASTAMLLWEIDRSLSQLTQLYGLERAARGYHASLTAVGGIQSLVTQYGLQCRMRARPSLYLASEDTDRPLRDEFELRARIGLPGQFLDHKTLLQMFGITRAGAILSSGAADADPVLLTNQLLDISLARGVRLLNGNATAYDADGIRVSVGLDNDREIEARHVVLATGYVMPDIVRPTIQQVASSWAIATTPQPHNMWRDEALIWDDSSNYHYARTTTDGRIIFGGEDDHEIVAPADREAATPAKVARLKQSLKALWPQAELDIAYRWSGTFDTTSDGLPLIGRVPGHKNIFAAYGYGGNGITFSYLAAELIAALIAGKTSPLLDDFAIDRDGR